eukprot:gene24294-31603_t
MVWDIQHTLGDTISVVLQDSNGVYRRSRLLHYINARGKIRGVAALCVVEIKSELACEYQLLTYLMRMMNNFGMRRVAGVLVYANGTCRLYRANDDLGDSVLETLIRGNSHCGDGGLMVKLSPAELARPSLSSTSKGR